MRSKGEKWGEVEELATPFCTLGMEDVLTVKNPWTWVWFQVEMSKRTGHSTQVCHWFLPSHQLCEGHADWWGIQPLPQSTDVLEKEAPEWVPKPSGRGTWRTTTPVSSQQYNPPARERTVWNTQNQLQTVGSDFGLGKHCTWQETLEASSAPSFCGLVGQSTTSTQCLFASCSPTLITLHSSNYGSLSFMEAMTKEGVLTTTILGKGNSTHSYICIGCVLQTIHFPKAFEQCRGIWESSLYPYFLLTEHLNRQDSLRVLQKVLKRWRYLKYLWRLGTLPVPQLLCSHAPSRLSKKMFIFITRRPRGVTQLSSFQVPYHSYHDYWVASRKLACSCDLVFI